MDSTPTAASSSDRVLAIRHALETVSDPEIPPLSIVDLGMVTDVHVAPGKAVVSITPTFAGCPALDMIKQAIVDAVTEAGEPAVEVRLVFDPPWTTNRLTENGRKILKEFGIAPPGKRCSEAEYPNVDKTPCPFCDSSNTEVESIFGPTLCRSIHYCHDCLQSFEHFKPV
ncbi:MAG: 1,2-phenylacetyl-CoA epoxidase subunit PaaD [Phycisphaerae bacterium]